MNALHQYICSANRLMDEMHDLTDAQLHFRPTANAWNLLQVLQHLQKVEEGVITQIFKHNLSDQKRYMRFKNHYRAHLLLLAMYTPRKYKVPVNEVMPDDILSRTVIDEWEQQQKQWLGDSRLHPESRSQIVFKHPLAGGLNCRATFNFLRAHLNHHLIQVNSIKIHHHFPKI
ncbi:MAG: DinB family protein [Flavobacteriales bacterium]